MTGARATPAALAALLVLGSPAVAAAEAVRVGAGTRLCGEFIRDYADNPSLAEGVYFSWAQGYLVGFSEATSGGRPSLDLEPGDLVTARQRRFVREFCRRNPGADYVEAVEALFLRILERNE